MDLVVKRVAIKCENVTCNHVWLCVLATDLACSCDAIFFNCRHPLGDIVVSQRASMCASFFEPHHDIFVLVRYPFSSPLRPSRSRLINFETISLTPGRTTHLRHIYRLCVLASSNGSVAELI